MAVEKGYHLPLFKNYYFSLQKGRLRVHMVLYVGREQKIKRTTLKYDVDNSVCEENKASLRGKHSLFIMNAFGNQIIEMWKCRKSVLAYWRPTWGSLVDRLYQIIEAHALGSWLTLEIITTGKELVWWKERMQNVNAAKESGSAVLCFGFFSPLFLPEAYASVQKFWKACICLWFLLKIASRIDRPVVWSNRVVL